MIKLISHELLMILARKGRIDLIRTLKSHPDRDFTINELARVSRVPTMTAWRAVKDLKSAGLIKTREVGNALCISMSTDHEKLRLLRLIPETDPHRTSAKTYASRLASKTWLRECRLFGSIGRGEHSPGDEVDIAVVFDETMIEEGEAKAIAIVLAEEVKMETNVSIAPLLIPFKDMAKRGGFASELRDKEVIWRR